MSMGSPCSPSVCGLTFSVFEEDFLKKYNGHKHWARHIDDIFSIFTGTKRQLQYSLKVLNSISEEFKFKFEISNTKVDFLDITISLDRCKVLQTDIFRAPAKIAVYVHWKSGHQISTKKSIIKSTCIRFRRICSSVEKYNKACAELCKTLMNRDYPYNIINTIINEVRDLDRDQLLERKVHDDSCTSQPPRATILYVPEVSNQLRNIINKHWDQIKDLFDSLSYVYVNGISIGDILLKGQTLDQKFPYCRNTDNAELVSFNINNFVAPAAQVCTKRSCKACDENFVIPSTRDSCTINLNGWTLQIPHHQICTDRNIIYLIGCNKCQNMLYVGETSQSLVERLYGHRARTSDVYGHFTVDGHSLENLKITILSKMSKGSSSVERKGREYFYLKLLKPVLGLNVDFCPP